MAGLGLGAVVCSLFAQRPFREYPAWEYNNFPLPSDYQRPGEWTFARLMYPTTHFVIDWQSEYKRGYDWHEGNTNWTIDYPRSDRHLSQADPPAHAHRRQVRRAAHQPGRGRRRFQLPLALRGGSGPLGADRFQIAKFREFLLRGGFFMCDDFHGTDEWNVFIASMNKVLPDRPIVDLPNDDPIFHTVYDLDDRYQVPG